MEPAQILAAVLGSSVIGGVVVKSMEWIKDAKAGRMQNRRAEVDRAIAERDEAEEAEEKLSRRLRVVEESLAIHRRIIIDAQCLGPDKLPKYP